MQTSDNWANEYELFDTRSSLDVTPKDTNDTNHAKHTRISND